MQTSNQITAPSIWFNRQIDHRIVKLQFQKFGKEDTITLTVIMAVVKLSEIQKFGD